MSADIRPARASDLEALLAIEEEVFTGDRLSRRSIRHHIDNPSASLLVAELDDRIVGYALLFHPRGRRVARLYSLAVSAKFAARGLGRKLLLGVEQRARERGLPMLSLEVREDNLPALKLYQRSGFDAVAKLVNYYQDGAPALRLHKVLEPDA